MDEFILRGSITLWKRSFLVRTTQSFHSISPLSSADLAFVDLSIKVFLSIHMN